MHNLGADVIYILTENGEPYTYHTDHAEADRYLRDLRQVYPQQDWDIEPKTTGRLPGQAVMIWGGECVVDLLTHEIHQWAKVYIWRGMAWKPPELHEDIYKYLPMNFETTNESEAVSVVKTRLAGLEFKSAEGTDRVVRVR